MLKRTRVLPPARVIRMLSQIALGLDEAHARHFVHRDLKPDNIFLCGTRDGDVVKLLDFGSVKDKNKDAKKLTVLGTTIGSPYYMAPEQAQGLDTLDARADVFALAAITYECITGFVPFDGTNGPSILLVHPHQGPDPSHQARRWRPLPGPASARRGARGSARKEPGDPDAHGRRAGRRRRARLRAGGRSPRVGSAPVRHAREELHRIAATDDAAAGYAGHRPGRSVRVAYAARWRNAGWCSAEITPGSLGDAADGVTGRHDAASVRGLPSGRVCRARGRRASPSATTVGDRSHRRSRGAPPRRWARAGAGSGAVGRPSARGGVRPLSVMHWRRSVLAKEEPSL